MSRAPRPDHEIVAAALAVLAGLAALAPGRAEADVTTRPARIEYDAPPACPDARAFEGQMRARSSRIALTTDATPDVRVVRVRITDRARSRTHAERFEGDVVIVEPGGGPSQQRHVDGTCPDVVAALGLIAALALDPMASTSPTTAGPADAPPGAKADEPKPSNPAPAPAPAPPMPPKPESPPKDAPAIASDERAPSAELAKHAWRWSIGAGLGVTDGVTPSLLVSIPVFVDVARVSPGVVAPAVRLRFERATSDQSGASFTWAVGSLDGCPLAFASGPLRVWPCARLAAGALAATGDVAAARSSTRPWLSAGAVVRARLAIVGGLFLEAEGQAFAAFVRDRFYLEPDATVHRAAPIATTGAIDLGASFW